MQKVRELGSDQACIRSCASYPNISTDGQLCTSRGIQSWSFIVVGPGACTNLRAPLPGRKVLDSAGVMKSNVSGSRGAEINRLRQNHDTTHCVVRAIFCEQRGS